MEWLEEVQLSTEGPVERIIPKRNPKERNSRWVRKGSVD